MAVEARALPRSLTRLRSARAALSRLHPMPTFKVEVTTLTNKKLIVEDVDVFDTVAELSTFDIYQI